MDGDARDVFRTVFRPFLRANIVLALRLAYLSEECHVRLRLPSRVDRFHLQRVSNWAVDSYQRPDVLIGAHGRLSWHSYQIGCASNGLVWGDRHTRSVKSHGKNGRECAQAFDGWDIYYARGSFRKNPILNTTADT